MFFILFGFWVLLNGQWTTEIAVVGLVLSAALYWFLCKFVDYSPRKEWRLLKRIGKIVGYGVYLLGQIFLSAWAVIKLIWSPKLVVEPQLAAFDSHLRTDAGRVTLANSITLTPGTITVDIQDGRYLVHCLDADMAEGLQDSDMERRVRRVEGGAEQ